MDNKQKIIDNLINLLNGVTTRRDETNFFYKSLQIKTTFEKASHINETISSNRFSIAQNKNQLNVAKEQLTAAPLDTSTKQNIENFWNCNTVTVHDDVIINAKKQFIIWNTTIGARKNQWGQVRPPTESDKGTKNISLENEAHYKWIKNITLIVGDSIVSGIEENKISRQWGKIKVKSFPGATIEDMYDYIRPLLKKCPKNIILRIGTNNTVNET